MGHARAFLLTRHVDMGYGWVLIGLADRDLPLLLRSHVRLLSIELRLATTYFALHDSRQTGRLNGTVLQTKPKTDSRLSMPRPSPSPLSVCTYKRTRGCLN